MITYPELQEELARACEKLRVAGLSEDKIQDFRTSWIRVGSFAELEENVDRLRTLRVGADDQERELAFNEFTKAMDSLEEIVKRPEVALLLNSKLPDQAQPKYLSIEVALDDLNGEIWSILRRVSYAMSDAGIGDAEIEQYKEEVKRTNDPAGVSGRWVRIT